MNSNTQRIALDGGHIDIDQLGGHVEVNIRVGDRTVFGMALSHTEAEALGLALARPDGPTVTDLFAVADSMGLSAAAMVAGGAR